jgi:hypothetical protein
MYIYMYARMQAYMGYEFSENVTSDIMPCISSLGVKEIKSIQYNTQYMLYITYAVLHSATISSS